MVSSKPFAVGSNRESIATPSIIIQCVRANAWPVATAWLSKVGLLKGLVVVTEQPPNSEKSDFIDMRLLRAPRSYCCRLYIVKGMHLQPKDLNGLADPYIQLKASGYRPGNDS